jgi:polyhydroxyalkanoate synthesis repressor PhaR
MVKRGIDFVVQDARTGEDITRQVLTQIIVEEENRGESLLPIQFLRQLIRFYGGGGPALLPGYLTASMEHFAKQQESWREAFAQGSPAGFLEEQTRQNMALWERTFRAFSPFTATPGASAPGAVPEPAAEPDELSDLKRKLDDMSRQIERLAAKE